MKKLLPLILLAAFIVGCSNQAQPTASDAEVATRVAQILTSMPTATQEPKVIQPTQPLPTVIATQIPTKAPVQATATEQPQEPTVTPTLEVTPTASATNTPQATPTGPTPTASSTPLPTFTPIPGDPRTTLGKPDWTDNMDNGDNWPTGADAAGFSEIAFKDGSMDFTALKTQAGWRLTWRKEANVYIEMVVKSPDCSKSDNFGLIFRAPFKETADRGYLFGIRCEGKYSLRKWDGTATPGVLSYLTEWKASPAILAGPNQTNRIGVMLVNDRIIMYINGVKVGEEKDSTWQEGYFGVFAGAATSGKFNILVDSISVWENPKP